MDIIRYFELIQPTIPINQAFYRYLDIKSKKTDKYSLYIQYKRLVVPYYKKQLLEENLDFSTSVDYTNKDNDKNYSLKEDYVTCQ